MSVQKKSPPEASIADFTEILRRQRLSESSKNSGSLNRPYNQPVNKPVKAKLLKPQSLKMRQVRGEKTVNTAVDSFNSSANRNLSRVLLEIKDDGPAYSSSSQAGELHDYIAQKQQEGNDSAANSSAQELNQDEFNQDDILSLSSAALKQKRKLKIQSFLPKSKISFGKWLLLITVTAIFAVSLFMFDLRAKDIEKSLTVYEKQLQQSMAFQSEAMPADITKINAQLQTLQHDLKFLKENNSTVDKKDEDLKEASMKEASLNEARLAEEIEKSGLLEKDISILKDEIQLLKNDLKTANDKIEVVNKKVIANKILKQQAVKKSGYSIALASLTNKVKAEKIVKQLADEGLTPAMKVAVVNGNPIYRLSVSGFINREAAESFILTALKKYGVKDLRIRKINNG